VNQRVLIIVNPHAGKGMIKRYLCDVIDLFVKHQWQVSVVTTQAKGEATQLASDAALHYDLLVCSGGDGTLNEVVSGLVKDERHIPIGYLPAGTTNDFASSLQIPKNNLPAAAQQIIDGKGFLCDVGHFNDRIFMYVAAFGAFTEVSYSTPQDFKNNFGRAAYILEGIKSLTNIVTYHLKVECENELIEGDFIYGQISNSTSVGGFQAMSLKDVQLDDGLFELLLVHRPNNLLDLQTIIAALLTQDENSSWLVHRKLSKVKITCETPVPWTLDGEFGGNHQTMVIRNLPKAVEFIVRNEEQPLV